MAMASGTEDVVTKDLEEMSFSFKTKQTGYTTLEAAILHQSLVKRLPIMYGKLTSDTSERILPACLLFKSFDKQGGETSFVDHKKRDSESCRTNLMNKIGDQLPFGAQTVASTLVNDAATFVLALFIFMTKTKVIQNAAQDGAGKKFENESWAFVSHVVRAIFHHLHDISRKATLHPKDPASMDWQFMKTLKEQNKILKIGIKDFFVVTNVLHVHMKRNAVMSTEIDTKLKAIGKVCQAAVLAAEKTKLVGDKAVTLTANIESKLGKKG